MVKLNHVRHLVPEIFIDLSVAFFTQTLSEGPTLSSAFARETKDIIRNIYRKLDLLSGEDTRT